MFKNRGFLRCLFCVANPSRAKTARWNRKHVPCFYRVIETRVKVWKNEKCCGNTSRRRVFPQLFRVLLNFHECFYLTNRFHVAVRLFSNRSQIFTENLQRKQNWTAKSTNIKESAGRINSVFVIRAALWAVKLECFLEYCLNWKNTYENMRLRSTLDAIWFEFRMKGGLPTVEICVLCGSWFSN